ncbi:glycosidase [Salmonella enterica subsp. enterica]|nr:glycosidase [Salmonella enterica subsp. enterica]
MNKKLLIATMLTGLLSGCVDGNSSSGSMEGVVKADPRYSDCNLPDVNEKGPIPPGLFISGTLPEGYWLMKPERKMHYKGDGIYQLVYTEKAGALTMQFATMNWNPQFTVIGLELPLNQANSLKKGGMDKNTKVVIPADGKYVWTIHIAPDKQAIAAMVSPCK